ncbi:S-DNA-T family DNA segregation ATPase FtsK/SpoIIIE [Paenibacillus sp. DS2015]|uniref:FtsK/SpoIIIE domain-containing protein n=1 Tax=Paenibacillus sp. DS2015 TaxID=3373917 RepID=UPI003D228F66
MITSSTTLLAGAVGSATSAYMVYRGLPENVMRRKLEGLFKTGEVFLKIVGYKKKELRSYPKIKRVKMYFDRNEAVFTLPIGIDPSVVTEKEWLFKQVFGEFSELHMNDDSRTFVLKAYGESVEQYSYDIEAVKTHVQGVELPIYAGKDRNGYVVYDMVPNPNLLIAGEPGSGKSACIRSVLTTLIKTVDGLELYCADLKRSEFHLFKGIAIDVATTPPEILRVVMKLQRELEKRGRLLELHEMEHVNQLPKEIRPPYIVFAIDEVALLKKDRDIMDGIEWISTIGRALGVYLILSMQRPDANVLDGKLKNNLTVRFGFRHSDEINSRITISSGESAHIKNSEKGKMYMKFDGISAVQGSYLGVPEARALLAPFKWSKGGVDKGDRIDITEESQEVEGDNEEDEIEMGMLG